jgi:hypothetical protein
MKSPNKILVTHEKDFKTFQEMDLAPRKREQLPKKSGKFSKNPKDG